MLDAFSLKIESSVYSNVIIPKQLVSAASRMLTVLSVWLVQLHKTYYLSLWTILLCQKKATILIKTSYQIVRLVFRPMPNSTMNLHVTKATGSRYKM